MNGLGVLAEIVPEHVRVLEMGLGIALLGVDEVRESSGNMSCMNINPESNAVGCRALRGIS
jgi:hypothetical protein